MRVASLGYISLSLQDPLAWRGFGVSVLGLMEASDSSDERLLLRMDEHPYRVSITRGDEDRLDCAGWEVEDSAALETAVNRLQAAGAPVTRGDAAGAAERCVSEYVRSADPDGNEFELYYGRTDLKDDFVSGAGVERFISGELGMGHVVIPAPMQDQTHAFYKDVLGFADSDDLTLPPPAEGAPNMRVVFLHAANPRHHSLALYNFPVPSGVVHIIFEVPDIDTVGKCLDRVQAAELPLMATLGRHENDNALSFYVFGPGGIGVEYGCEGKLIDFENYQATTSTVGDIWGHAYEPVG